MAIPASPDELPRFQPALLGKHCRQQSVRGDVEWDPQEQVGAALVQLQAEFPVRDVDLEEGVAGHQRHVGQLPHVPSGHHHSPGVRVALDRFQQLCDLVDSLSVRARPGSPLHAVDRSQFAVLISPLVPDANPVLLQPRHVRGAGKEPQKLTNHGFQVNSFGGDYGKPF